VKIDEVLAYMRAKCKWGVWEFVEAYATAELAISFARSARRRAGCLVDIIEDNEKVPGISISIASNSEVVSTAIRGNLTTPRLRLVASTYLESLRRSTTWRNWITILVL
jgi:hypothetical protein